MNRILLGYTPVSASVAFTPALDKAQLDKEFKDGEVGIIVSDPLPAGSRSIVVSAAGYKSLTLSATLDGTPGVLPLAANLERLPTPAPQPTPAPSVLDKPLTSDIAFNLSSPTSLQISASLKSPAIRIRMKQSTALDTAGVILPFTKTDGLTPGALLTFYFYAEDGTRVSEPLILPYTVPSATPAPQPTPTPPPAPRLALAIGDLRSSGDPPTYARWMASNPAELATIKSSGLDCIWVMVDKFSLEAFRPGWKFDQADFRGQLEGLVAALGAERLGVVLHTMAPGGPTDDAAWDATIAELGQAFAVLRLLGIKKAVYDNEPYHTLSGSPLVYDSPEVVALSQQYGVPINITTNPDGSISWNYWDFGIQMLFGKTRAHRDALAGQFRKLANALASANPGLHWNFYHDVAASDGAAPYWVNKGQAGNGFFGLAAMIVGMCEAVASDTAPIFVGGFNEDFEVNVSDDGPDIFARILDYRKGAIGNYANLLTVSDKLKASWSTLFGFGQMRRKGSAATNDAASLSANLKAILASGIQAPSAAGQTGTALVGLYSESGDHWPLWAWDAVRGAKI